MALIPVLWTEIDEVGAVAKHVVDRHQHRVRKGHLSALRASAGGQAPVTSREEVGVGAARTDRAQGGFDES